MHKHLIVLGIAVLLICVGLSGCTEENKNNITETTPYIQFVKEWGSLRVVSTNSTGLNWSHINITISSGNYSVIHFSPAEYMSITLSYGNGTSCPANWGFISTIANQSINFHIFDDDITVTLKWIPTDTIIGEWIFP